jgi:RimJ/RimL family protein N-acetyltransferase
MIISRRGRISLSGDIDHNTAIRHRNDERVFRWCRQHTLISPPEQILWSKKIVEDDSIKMFSIRHVTENDQIGVCGFTSIDRLNRSAEFSLYIGWERQGDGLGREALETLLIHGFDCWNFHRIWGVSFQGNPALKLFKKMGFKGVGFDRQATFKDGKYIDNYRVDMLRGELVLMDLPISPATLAIGTEGTVF